MNVDYCSSRNERIRIEVFKQLKPETKAALAKFFRDIGSAHAMREIIEPITCSPNVLFVAAIQDRPWPPRGIGAQIIEALAIAIIGEDHRAFLTPVLVTPQNVINIGLMAALTKKLIKELQQESVKSMRYIARADSALLAHILAEAGFAPCEERVVTENANFIHFAAQPEEVLERLGLTQSRIGELLSLSLEPIRISALTQYHLGLSAAAQGFWADRTDWVFLLPGLIDWVATLPPGGSAERRALGFPCPISQAALANSPRSLRPAADDDVNRYRCPQLFSRLRVAPAGIGVNSSLHAGLSRGPARPSRVKCGTLERVARTGWATLANRRLPGLQR
jgi:hypothetical protein